jgi:hypothetical protein
LVCGPTPALSLCCFTPICSLRVLCWEFSSLLHFHSLGRFGVPPPSQLASFLFYFFVHLFTCAYIVWVISPPCPHLTLPLPPLSFRKVPFCLYHWFCWRKDICIIRKTKCFC